jgi:sugar lactone lactonase YvrE
LLGAAASAQAQIYGLKTSEINSDEQYQDSVLFTIAPSPSKPFPIAAGEKLNGNVSAKPITLGGNPVWADGLAINSKGDLFAYIHSKGAFNQSWMPGTAQLVSIEKDGTAKVIDSTPLPGAWISAAAFDMNDNLWIVNNVDRKLMRIDPANGEVQDTRDVQGVSIMSRVELLDIAFDIDNNAYLSLGQNIYSLNVTSGAVNPTALQTFPPVLTTGGSVNVNGMAFYRNGEVWFSQALGDNRIAYSADPSVPFVGSDPVVATDTVYNVVDDLTADVQNGGYSQAGHSGTMDLAARPNRVTAKDDSVSALLNTPLQIPVSSILANDKEHWNALGVNVSVDDSGALPINTWPKTTANGGTVNHDAVNGVLTYTPKAGFLGTDTFDYRALVPDGSWAKATVKVSVQAAVPANNPTALISLALGMVGAGGMLLRCRRKQVP